jgi:serine protein kinase
MATPAREPAAQRGESFVESLSAYSRLHRAQHWSGTFGEFLRTVVPGNARQLARTSHEYLWDMLNWYGRPNSNGNGGESAGAKELFKRELYGIDDPLGRVVD